ncbi:MAG: hypothetical protein H0X24_10000 [Ktedonobacterales bacterium]|nr:hypothetical protein [Ktedonobacterales bacterium]
MSKTKLKCGDCGKPFRATRASQLFCEECERKRRQHKAQGASNKAVVTPPTAGKPAWMAKSPVRDATTPYTAAVPVPTTDRVARPGGATPTTTATGRPSLTPRTPRPPREPKPPVPHFEVTPAHIAAIEARYLALAQPEFDGIRTQIANELHIPKRVVKEAVRDLRARMQMPSWWDMQGYQGELADLDRIRAAYDRYLPVPPVGIHKAIAAELGLSPTQVYRGISAVRQTLGLPHFNDPAKHPEMPRSAVAQPSLT